MLVRAFSVMVAGSLIAAAGALGLMASERQVPIEVLESEVVTKEVRPGSMLERRLKIIQHDRCHIHTDRIIYDSQGIRFILDPLEFQAGISPIVGEELQFTARTPIPFSAAFGPGRLENSTVYRCNILHWLFPIYGPPMKIEFEVVPL